MADQYSQEALQELAKDYIKELTNSESGEEFAKKLAWHYNNMGEKEFMFHMSAVVAAMTFFNAPLEAYWALIELIRDRVDHPKGEAWDKCIQLYMKMVARAIHEREISPMIEGYTQRQREVFKAVDEMRQAVLNRQVTHALAIYGETDEDGILHSTTFASVDSREETEELLEIIKNQMKEGEKSGWREE